MKYTCLLYTSKTGHPLAPDAEEPRRVAESVALMKLRYVVVTSVTRDDLPDGGAAHWAQTVRAIRTQNPDAVIELLIPDLDARLEGDLLSVAVDPVHLPDDDADLSPGDRLEMCIRDRPWATEKRRDKSKNARKSARNFLFKDETVWYAIPVSYTHLRGSVLSGWSVPGLPRASILGSRGARKGTKSGFLICCVEV